MSCPADWLLLRSHADGVDEREALCEQFKAVTGERVATMELDVELIDGKRWA